VQQSDNFFGFNVDNLMPIFSGKWYVFENQKLNSLFWISWTDIPQRRSRRVSLHMMNHIYHFISFHIKL